MSKDKLHVGLIAGQVPVLRSNRIVLRPLREDDALRIQSLVNDFDVVRWMSRIPHPYTVDDARYFIDRIAPLEISWVIDVTGEGLVGISGFAFKSEGTDVELGYWLGQPYWGFGYATEAARRMLDHAWSSGTQRILSGCFDGNVRSQHVLEKCGFRVVGNSTRFNLARDIDLPHIDMIIERPTIIGAEGG